MLAAFFLSIDTTLLDGLTKLFDPEWWSMRFYYPVSGETGG